MSLTWLDGATCGSIQEGLPDSRVSPKYGKGLPAGTPLLLYETEEGTEFGK